MPSARLAARRSIRSSPREHAILPWLSVDRFVPVDGGHRDCADEPWLDVHELVDEVGAAEPGRAVADEELGGGFAGMQAGGVCTECPGQFRDVVPGVCHGRSSADVAVLRVVTWWPAMWPEPGMPMLTGVADEVRRSI